MKKCAIFLNLLVLSSFLSQIGVFASTQNTSNGPDLITGAPPSDNYRPCKDGTPPPRIDSRQDFETYLYSDKNVNLLHLNDTDSPPQLKASYGTARTPTKNTNHVLPSAATLSTLPPGTTCTLGESNGCL